MKEPTVLQLLWQNSLCYEHILQQIFLYLDSSSIRNLKLSNMELRNFVQRVLWQNKRSHRCLHYRLKNRWVHSVWKSLKMSHFNFSLILAFSIIFCPINVHSKCKRSSLRSQCWMRLFLWFSNTVGGYEKGGLPLMFS